MLDFVFIMEADRLLPQIAERDREAVLSILMAYVKEAKKEAQKEAQKEESSR